MSEIEDDINAVAIAYSEGMQRLEVGVFSMNVAAAWKRLVRLARLGAAVEAMAPNSGLFKHNDDTWTARACVMDAVWDLPMRGYSVPSGRAYHRTPSKAFEEIESQRKAIQSHHNKT